jgi:hypothetical protein
MEIHVLNNILKSPTKQIHFKMALILARSLASNAWHSKGRSIQGVMGLIGYVKITCKIQG